MGSHAGSLLATALSGVLYGLAFPTASFQAVAWVALVPFLLAVRTASLRGTLVLAWIWTLVAAYTLGEWFPGTVATYFDQPLLVGIAFFVGVSTLMAAGYFASFAVCYRLLTRTGPAPLLVAAAWVAAELARGRFLTGDPLALFGYSQVGIDPLVQVADVTGVYGIGFALAAVNAAVADVLLAPTSSRRAAVAGFGRAGLTAAVVVAYGFVRLHVIPPAPEGVPVKVAIAQGNADLGSLWRPEFYGTNLDRYLGLTLTALRDYDPAVVFWPESAMSFFVQSEPLYQAAIAGVLQHGRADLVGGGPRVDRADGGTYHNTAFLMRRDGTIRGWYDKEHLLPFAEYFPLARFDFLRRRFARVREFRAGEPPPSPLPTAAGPAGVAICNEAMFPEIVGARVRQGAAYIVNPANDTWLSRKFSAQLFDMVTLRAIEQRRSVVRASTSGPSGVVDPFGHVLGKTAPFTTTVTAGWIRPTYRLTVYGRVGDAFAVACTIAAVAGCVLAARAR